jgi:hypothetical protein
VRNLVFEARSQGSGPLPPTIAGVTQEQTLPLDLPPLSTASRGKTTRNSESDGIFGWYQYIQDFTGSFALDWLKRLAQSGTNIWEPFAGSGTTLVAAKMLGLDVTGFDISPFMVDVARTKVDWSLDPQDIEAALEQVLEVVAVERATEPLEVVRGHWDAYDAVVGAAKVSYPGDKKLQKWIAPSVVCRCQALLDAIDRVPDARNRRFLRLAAASTLIPASNMSFRPNICYETHPTLDFPVVSYFDNRVRQMIVDYEPFADAGQSSTEVHLGDARTDGPTEADLVFTSPPYPNDMEYVHQTRLELALLNYVSDRRDLTALKKQMISSSVKLVYRDNEWQKAQGLEIPGVAKVFKPLAATLEGRNWGWNAADMTAQFFGGMRAVLRNWHQRLATGGRAAVVIGDSAFNGVKISTDMLLAETADLEGFDCEDIEVFRSRWNTKHNIELRESVVVLTKRRTR